ncbi:putative oxidoreductase YteT precursor [compost metagenome]
MNEQCGSNIPVFTSFDQMIAQVKPDTVIITTIDRYHHEYIIRALESRCDVISEKPLTVDAKQCKEVLEAEQRTGRKVRVTFNCRYMPYVVRIKELLASGVIGQIHSIHLEWFLDTSHGADYFRRWHRKMDNSGGLLVHKSTHHFDMVNWWLDDEPLELHAWGDLRFYGPNREERGGRCHTCSHARTCNFYYDITADKFTKSLYFDAESHDGYIRDACVFGDEIDIYDTMAVNVKYSKGTLLSYSLTAYNPFEGWKAVFVGDKGRMEAEHITGKMIPDDPNEYIRYYNKAGEETTVQVRKSSGGHGGGDERLRRMLFVGDLADPLHQQAGSLEGAMSMLIGAGANISIALGKTVVIRDLLT